MLGLSHAIERHLPAMSKSHRLLAAYVQEHGEQAAFMTSFQLASVTGLSQSTVMRFATLLGYSGYGGFQEALREQLKYRLDAMGRYTLLGNAASESDLLAALAATDALNIKNTLSYNSPDTLMELAQCLRSAARVYIYGQGFAAGSALYLAGYLGLLLPAVTCANLSAMDAHTTLAGIGEGDLLVCITFPLHRPDTVSLLGLARSRGARVAVISESRDSKAGALAHISLMSEWGELGVNGSMAPVIALCNALICLTARQMGEAPPGLAGLDGARFYAPQEGP